MLQLSWWAHNATYQLHLIDSPWSDSSECLLCVEVDVYVSVITDNVARPVDDIDEMSHCV